MLNVRLLSLCWDKERPKTVLKQLLREQLFWNWDVSFCRIFVKFVINSRLSFLAGFYSAPIFTIQRIWIVLGRCLFYDSKRSIGKVLFLINFIGAAFKSSFLCNFSCLWGLIMILYWIWARSDRNWRFQVVNLSFMQIWRFLISFADFSTKFNVFWPFVLV